jgi:hypothetical protein
MMYRRKQEEPEVVRVPGRMTVHLDGDNVDTAAGDYLVFVDGVLFDVLPPAEFDKQYEEVPAKPDFNVFKFTWPKDEPGDRSWKPKDRKPGWVKDWPSDPATFSVDGFPITWLV